VRSVTVTVAGRPVTQQVIDGGYLAEVALPGEPGGSRWSPSSSDQPSVMVQALDGDGQVVGTAARPGSPTEAVCYTGDHAAVVPGLSVGSATSCRPAIRWRPAG
jgi:hypothetical protein